MVFLRFIIFLMLLLNYAIGTAQSDSIKRTPSDSLKLTDSTAYGIVEQMPAFIGKDGSLTNFVKRNITYPQTLRENGISGQVWVYFIISKDSTVKRVWIDPVRSTDQRPFIDEALRVMRQTNKLWIPGRINGRAVDVKLLIPITFQLE